MKRILVSIFMLMVLFSSGIGIAQEQTVDIGLKVGVMAPDFTALTYEGKEVTLSNYYQDGPVVLIFYRGAWCPYCNIHLKSFQTHLNEFKQLGATVLAVSVDKPEYGASTVKAEGLGFDVISDSQAEILKAYHVVFQVPDELAQKYLNEYHLDLEAHSGRKDHVIAVPATYVIDQTGEIIFAYANEDYKVRTKPEEVLEVLKNLK